jgi:hypothetical protein
MQQQSSMQQQLWDNKLKEYESDGFLYCSTRKQKKQSLLQTEINQVNTNETWENQWEMELSKVLAEVSPSTGQLQTVGWRKLKEDGCKELLWLTINRNTDIASCEVCVYFPSTADHIYKIHSKRFRCNTTG